MQLYNSVKKKFYIINVGKELEFYKACTFKFSSSDVGYWILKLDRYGYYEFVKYTEAGERISIERGYNAEKLYNAIVKEKLEYAGK